LTRPMKQRPLFIDVLRYLMILIPA